MMASEEELIKKLLDDIGKVTEKHHDFLLAQEIVSDVKMLLLARDDKMLKIWERVGR